MNRLKIQETWHFGKTTSPTTDTTDGPSSHPLTVSGIVSADNKSVKTKISPLFEFDVLQKLFF